MLIAHCVLVLANATVWGSILIGLFHNFVKTKTESDLRLFVAYLFMGGFILGEIILISCEIPPMSTLPIIMVAEERMLALLNLESMVGMLIAITIVMRLMRQVATEIGMSKRINAARYVINCVLILFVLIVNAIYVSTQYIDDFPVRIGDFALFNMILISAITILISVLTPSKFLAVLKNINVNYSPYRNRHDFRYAMLMNFCLYTFLAGTLVRMYLATTWAMVITGDVLMLIALVLGFWSTFAQGFGETISTILNLRAIYFVHFSGLPIYSYVFSRLFDMDKYYFSSLIFTITRMVEKVVRDNKKLQRLVMQNGTELVVESGDLCIGIMITKKYHPFFKKKLQDMVRFLESEEREALTNWNGANECFDKKVNEIISKVM